MNVLKVSEAKRAIAILLPPAHKHIMLNRNTRDFEREMSIEAVIPYIDLQTFTSSRKRGLSGRKA